MRAVTSGWDARVTCIFAGLYLAPEIQRELGPRVVRVAVADGPAREYRADELAMYYLATVNDDCERAIRARRSFGGLADFAAMERACQLAKTGRRSAPSPTSTQSP